MLCEFYGTPGCGDHEHAIVLPQRYKPSYYLEAKTVEELSITLVVKIRALRVI